MKYSIRKRLIIYFCAMSILPVLIIGIFAYVNSVNSMKAKVHYEMGNSIEQLGKNIELRLERINYYMDFLFMNRDIQGIMKDFNDGKPVTEIHKKMDVFGQLFYKEPYIMTAMIFGNKEHYYLTYKNELLLDVDEIRRKSWVKDTLMVNGKIYWIGVETGKDISDRSHRVFSLARTVKNLVDNRPTDQIGYIYLSFSDRMFTDSHIKNDIGRIFVLDQFGRIISSNMEGSIYPNTEQLLKEHKHSTDRVSEAWLGKEKVLVSHYSIPQYQWKIVKIISYSYITNQTLSIAFVAVLMTFFCLFGLFVLSLIISRRIASPLIQLNNAMKSVEEGEFDVSTQVTSNDEIGQIQRRFNKMVLNIKELFTKTIEIEKEKRKEEIKALQYQVNPHFLYNTLNSIRLMANILKADHIAELTGSLIRLLKNAIGKAGNMVQLSMEIQNIKDFIDIQKIRYDEEIHVEYNIDEKCMDMLVPNFILQPIIENAIFHGIIPSGAQGCIVINAGMDHDHIIIEIHDNGKGMNEEELERVLTERVSSKSFVKIGLYNVQQRIKLNFGEEYGIGIHSRVGEGTLVTVTLPVVFSCKGD